MLYEISAYALVPFKINQGKFLHKTFQSLKSIYSNSHFDQNEKKKNLSQKLTVGFKKILYTFSLICL